MLYIDYNKSLIAYIKSTINKTNSMTVINLLQETNFNNKNENHIQIQNHNNTDNLNNKNARCKKKLDNSFDGR